MKSRKQTYTEKQLKTVAEILTILAFVESIEDLRTTCDLIYTDYGLCDDPFTRLPCTPKEYAENSLKYERQLMDEKYGHHDGLE